LLFDSVGYGGGYDDRGGYGGGRGGGGGGGYSGGGEPFDAELAFRSAVFETDG